MGPRQIDCRRATERGFTLLELLVAVTILGLILTLLFGGLRFGTRAWESTSDRIAWSTQLDVTQGFIRRVLGEAYPLGLPEASRDLTGGQALTFVGQRDSVVFTGLLPPQFGGGGFQRIQLSISDGVSGSELIVRWRRFAFDEDEFESEGDSHESVLIDRIAVANFDYFGETSPDDAPQWHDDWPAGDRLPTLVRLRLQLRDDDRYWPELVVAPKVTTRGVPAL